MSCLNNCIGPQPVAHVISPEKGQNNHFLNNFEPQPGPSGINTPTSTEKRQDNLTKIISQGTNGEDVSSSFKRHLLWPRTRTPPKKKMLELLEGKFGCLQL